MAGDIELERAVRVLQDRFGVQLKATKKGGRRQMADALEEAFDVPASRADKLIATLERANAIRWEQGEPPEAADATDTDELPTPREPSGDQSIVRMVDQPEEEGYWRLTG